MSQKGKNNFGRKKKLNAPVGTMIMMMMMIMVVQE